LVIGVYASLAVARCFPLEKECPRLNRVACARSEHVRNFFEKNSPAQFIQPVPAAALAAGGGVTDAWECEEEFAMRAIARFFRDERGTETLEWGLVCGLIVVGAIAAIVAVGPKVTAMWERANVEIQKAP